LKVLELLSQPLFSRQLSSQLTKWHNNPCILKTDIVILLDMKRSFQEILELVAFGLIALLVGTALLWVGGWLFGVVGWLLQGLAGLLWWVLRWILPVAILVGAVYAIVRLFQQQSRKSAATPAPTVTDAAAAPPVEPVVPATEPAVSDDSSES
jgi:uncharacterized membrane protein